MLAWMAVWDRRAQKRWFELGVETLTRHRETMDAMYRSGIRLIARAFHLVDADAARSPPPPAPRPAPKVSVARRVEDVEPRWWPGDRWVQRSDEPRSRRSPQLSP